MKLPHQISWIRPIRGRSGGRGLALVTTLMMLAIITVLMVAMLVSSTTEHALARTYSRVQSTRQLSQVAESLVISQIRTATESPGRMWANQPGAVHTFGQDGRFAAGYKLYSDSQMTVSDADGNGVGNEIASDLPPVDWNRYPSRYTDLNEPVERPGTGRGGNELYFPIADPRARVTSTAATAPFSNGVEGFSFDAGVVHGAGGTDRLAMPVEWIYVLEDGALGTLDEGFTFLPFDPSCPATVSNPIVGRVAFWADDESCKLNLNTVGEPTPWDVPRADTPRDRAYASFQPATKEFQRFPGHPATTAISGLFSGGITPMTTAEKETLYQLLPRLAPGGSVAGTVPVAPLTINIGKERLLDSSDEFLFRPDRKDVPTEITANPDMEWAGLTSVNFIRWLDRGDFFLTSQSRAPEMTRYGTPRVAMWPTSRDAQTIHGDARRTAYDELIRFCATGGGKAYYLERQDADSPFRDFAGIARNREIYGYLRQLCALPSPGGGSFLDKYGTDDRNQILASMLDYIRSANLYDSTLKWPGEFPATDPVGMPVPEVEAEAQFTDARYVLHRNIIEDGDPQCWEVGMTKGHGQVAPLKFEADGKSYQGFGRFHTLSEFGIHFICCGAGDQGANVGGYGDPGGQYGDWSGQRFYSNIPRGAVSADSYWAPLTALGVNVADPKVQNLTLEPNTRLKFNERRVQMSFVLEFFTPMQGDTGIYDDITVRMSGIGDGEFTLDGKSLGLPADDWSPTVRGMGNAWHDRMWGGGMGFRGFLSYKKAPARPPLPGDTGYSDDNKYPFVSVPVTVTLDKPGGMNRKMQFRGGDLTVHLYSGKGPRSERLVQSIEIQVPDADLPIPDLVKQGSTDIWRAGFSHTNMYGHTPIPPTYFWSFHADGAVRNERADLRWFPDANHPRNILGGINENAGRLRAATRSPDGNRNQGRWIQDEDVIHTMLPRHGDFRLVAGLGNVPKSVFVPHPDYGTSVTRAHNLWNTAWSHVPGNGSRSPNRTATSQLVPVGYEYHSWPDIAVDTQFANAPMRATGDFDNGIALVRDGAYINKPDEGNAMRLRNESWRVPYFDTNWWAQSVGPSFFSPNRQIPSPVMFGSLPSRMHGDLVTGTGSWTTLLFRPQRNHPGAAGPSDHWLLDLFWMPVVEPFAISEPFSTAGKINMNYQIAPFSYIRRDSGLRAVLKSEEMLAVPNSEGGRYKYGPVMPDGRYPINLDATLSQFRARFQSGRIFLGESEICDIHLVPKHPALSGATDASGMEAFWQNHRLTGDNSRERPYANIYPRLTTRSNVFRVHMRAQSLQMPRSGTPDVVDPERLTVATEYRGSTLVERFIDPSESALPDYAAAFASGNNEVETLAKFHRFRIVSSKRFAP